MKQGEDQSGVSGKTVVRLLSIIVISIVTLLLLSGSVSAHGIADGIPFAKGEALFLGLTVALMWGLIPVLNKRGYAYGGSPMVAAVVIVLMGLIIMWTSLTIVNGLSHPLTKIDPVAILAFLAGGFFGTAIGRITMFVGIDRVGANVTSGVIATNPAPAFFLGLLFLGEHITLLRLFAIGLIITGLVVLSLSKGGDIRGWDFHDIIFPLIAALVFGGGHVLRRFGITRGPNPLAVATPLEAAAINELAATVGILSFAFGYRKVHLELQKVPRKAYLYFMMAGVTGAIGLYTEFVLLVHEKAAIVTAIVATQVLFATIFSYFLLGDLERLTRTMLFGIVIVIVGLILIGV